MTKPMGAGRSEGDPVRAKVEMALSRHASDAHSEIQHFFVVNLADGGIEFRSESISRNPDMDQAFSGKYAEDTNFLTFLQDPRNHFNLTGTVDSYVFALKFTVDDRDDMALIGRVPIRGDTFRLYGGEEEDGAGCLRPPGDPGRLTFRDLDLGLPPPCLSGSPRLFHSVSVLSWRPR